MEGSQRPLKLAFAYSRRAQWIHGASIRERRSASKITIGMIVEVILRHVQQFLWNRGMDTQIGEIVVYNVKGKDIPIVHR